jgi:crossover junction endodeoxyribonuclease RuvC
MTIIGIDPGTRGGLAFLSDAQRIEMVCDIPTVLVKHGRRVRTQDAIKERPRTEVDTAALVALLQMYAPDPDLGTRTLAFLERVWPHPDEGVVSAFTFGRSVGIVEAALQALRIPFEFVHPAMWKKSVMPGCVPGKGQSIIYAKRLLPSAAEWITLTKHHNRADALLIALYGLRKLQRGGSP